MTFKQGISGNVNGRPKGAPDRRTIFREMIEPHREALVQKAVNLALDGNEHMLRLLLDRLLPAKPRIEEESFDRDKNQSSSEQLENIKQAMSNGEISSDYAYKASQVIVSQLKVNEYTKIEQLEKDLQEMKEYIKLNANSLNRCEVIKFNEDGTFEQQS